MLTLVSTEMYGILSAPYVVDDRLQLVEIDVAFEGMVRVGIVGVIDDDVDEVATRVLLVELRRGEVHVPGDDISVRDQDLAQDVLGAATLVGGDQLFVAVHLVHGVDEVVEAPGARIRLIAEHQTGPLVIGHRRRARVGEQIDVHVVGLQQERVVSGLPDRLVAFLASGHPDGFDHLDLPGLGPGPAAFVHSRVSFRLRRSRVLV